MCFIHKHILQEAKNLSTKLSLHSTLNKKHPPKGKVFIDFGAKDAILKGKSLLPKGIKFFSGNFDKGDVIEIFDETNHYIGKGIAKYSSEDLKNILKDLPEKTKCFIHRNEMIIL
ncbi:MAG TPA: hypothetical protein EYP03_02425 [Aquificae bacterium]|nr:hypothetical protein [Aquificota bacterium]